VRTSDFLAEAQDEAGYQPAYDQIERIRSEVTAMTKCSKSKVLDLLDELSE
jgi:hypothetical protein